MPLGTLDRTPPPFFKQGPSALSRLIFFSALAIFLMAADNRFRLTTTVRSTVATVLYPLQWLTLKPTELAHDASQYFQSLQEAQGQLQSARKKLANQALYNGQVEQLGLENDRLRKLLDLRPRLTTTAVAAEVRYDAADPYTRKVIIDKGSLQGIEAGSPVVDEAGVVGQVTRVQPLASEVTLLIDRDQAIPVLNVRTGARSVAYGYPTANYGKGSAASGGLMELRFMDGNADLQRGDLLTTSGVDGVYPPGLSVARIDRIERRADSAFAKIYCQPVAFMRGVSQVLVLKPLPLPPAVRELAEPPAPPPVGKKSGSKP